MGKFDEITDLKNCIFKLKEELSNKDYEIEELNRVLNEEVDKFE